VFSDLSGGAESARSTTHRIHEREIRSMLLADSKQRQLRELLRGAGHQPLALAELRSSWIDFPATFVSELDLSAALIERVYDPWAIRRRAPARAGSRGGSSRARTPSAGLGRSIAERGTNAADRST
jgi:hypothetical protein